MWRGPFGNRIHHLMRSFHPSTINISEGSNFRPPGRKKFLKNFLDLSSGLRPAPFRSSKQKEGPFMGRLRANFARLGNPMQNCHLRKEPYVMCFSSCSTVIQLLKWQGCHENDYFSRQIFKGGCKNEGLMQYKYMEKEIRKLHGRVLF